MSTKSGELYVEIGARLDGLERGLARQEQLMQRASRSMDQHAQRQNRSLALIGSGLALYGVERAMMGAVKSAAELDKTLAQLRAVTGANASQMEAFRKAAMLAGTTTAFSVNQAAQAQVELAKAGMTTAQIMGGGFKSAMTLAAAGGMDLAEASKTMANGLNLFNIQAKSSGKIADALATAANTTTADVSDFAMALTQGGTAAKAAGLSFNDTMLVLESLAKIGVKNSDAGTSMKAAILALLTPTKQQAEMMDQLGVSFVGANGKFKSAIEISAMLRSKLGGLTEAQRTNRLATIAGTDGVRALLSLYNAGPATLKVWETQLARQGTAATQAKTMQDNLGTSIDKLRNSVEAGGISLANVFAPQIRAAADGIGNLIRELEQSGQAEAFAQGVSDAIGGIGDAISAVSPVLSLAKTTMDELGGHTLAILAGSFVAARVAATGFSNAMGSITRVTASGALGLNPVGAALIALQVGVPIIAAIADQSSRAKSNADVWADKLRSVREQLDSIQGLRMSEAQAGARVAAARATEADLQQRITNLQQAGKGSTKEARDLQLQLTRAVQDRADAEAAYNRAKGKPERATNTATKEYQALLAQIRSDEERLQRIRNADPGLGANTRQATIRQLTETIAKNRELLRTQTQIATDTGWQRFANQIENARRNGLQPLSEDANRALYSITKMTSKTVGLKFGKDDDAKISDKIARIDDLAQRASNLGSREYAIRILTDSKSAEDALRRLARLVSSLQNGPVVGPNPERRAMGGRITGGIAGKDSVLALLMPGEIVLNAQQQHLVDRGYSLEEALTMTGAAYKKGGTVKPSSGGGGGKPSAKAPISGTKTPGKVASVPDKTSKAQDAAWSTLTNAHQIKMAQNDRAITSASLTPSNTDDRKALTQRQNLLSAWITSINAFASKHSPMSPSLRSSVEGEKSSAFSGIADAKQRISQLKTATPTGPTLPGALDNALAQAQLSGDISAQVDALRGQEAWYAAQMAKAKSPAVRAQLARALKDVRDQIKTLTTPEEDKADKPDKTDPYALPDDLDASMALAELTTDTSDDLAALGAEEKFYSGKLAEAQAAGDNAGVARMARALKSVREQMTSMTSGGAKGAGASGGGIEGSVFEGYGSTRANLVGSMASGSGSVGPGASGGYGAAASSGTIVNVTVNVAGSVTSEGDLARALAEPIRAELISIGQRNGSIFGGYA